MRVLFDFRSYQNSYDRGIGRYIYSLMEHFVRSGRVDVSILISTEKCEIYLSDDIANKINVYNIQYFESYDISKNFDFFIVGNFFEQCASVFECYPQYVLNKCDDIVGILYDLIPLIFPSNYLKDDTVRYNYAYCLELVKYASHLFAISECTTKDTMKYLNLPKERFTTIYGGADFERFKSKNSDRDYIHSDRKNHIICVSGTDKRKNFQGLVRAFAMAYEYNKIPEDSKLYLVCSSNEWFLNIVKDVIKNFKIKLNEQVIVTGYLPDNELVDLLSNAKASIFPSFYEGLGLPILESYIAGTPVFASDLSSTKEFVNQESAFNPYNFEDFENVIVRIFHDEVFCKQSLEYGRSITRRFNWYNSARIMIDKLEELKKNNKKRKNSKIAVFSILPPEQSGIATYSYKMFTSDQQKYDIFSHIHNLKNYEFILGERNLCNIFPLEMCVYIEFKEVYAHKIFVLGNSYHHIPILWEAMRTKNENGRTLYLHETLLLDFWMAFFNGDFVKFISTWYPEYIKKIDVDNLDIYNFARKYNIYGIRPLISLTRIKNVLVNNEIAKNLIFKELKEQELKEINVEVLFLPVVKIESGNTDLLHSGYKYTVGTFGIPNKTKMIDEIVNAVKILNEKFGEKYVNLIIAGYDCYQCNVDKYSNYSFVEIYDGKKDEELLTLMNSVDLAVQLRPFPHGESSGCVGQLLGIGQNILVSQEILDTKLQQYCHTVKGKLSDIELSQKIHFALENKKIYSGEDVEREYGYESFYKELASALKKWDETL